MDPSAPEYQYPGQVRASTHNPRLFSGQKEVRKIFSFMQKELTFYCELTFILYVAVCPN